VTNLLREEQYQALGIDMVNLKYFLGFIFACNYSYAQTTGAETNFGTGQYYANAGCPYDQSTLPAAVLSRSERLKNEATDINSRLELAKRKLGEIDDDRAFSRCQSSVNQIIKKACGGDSNEGRGESAVDDFEDHMRGVNMLMSQLNYARTYEVAYQGIMTSKMLNVRNIAGGGGETLVDDIYPGYLDEDTPDDKAIDVEPDSPVVPSGPDSCFNNYALGNGMIDPKICFSTNEKNKSVKDNCKGCLKPNGLYPRGLYPEKFKEYFDIQQEVAQLQKDHKSAMAKATCVEKHIDNAPKTGPDAGAYRRCIMTADPSATAADYCLFCDDAGQAEKKQKGFDLDRWGPSLLTAGAWIVGGLYANNQVKKTREGNWEAGYPSDDRQPVVMTNYVMNGFGQVVNSLQSAGAFGCSPSAGVNGQGQTVTTNGIGGFLQGIFSGNANVQVGGANGYPGSMLGGNGTLSGGVFGGNQNAGPWTSGNLNGSIAAQQQAIAQSQANLELLQRQNQQRMDSLNALANLQVTLQGLEAQNARTNEQIAQIQAQANSIYSGLGVNGGAGAGIGGNGQTGAGIRIGLDVSGYAGLNGGLNGGIYSGAPGTNYPPINNGYTGPGYQIPNNSGSNNNNYYNGGSGNTGSGLAVPSLGL
jgi:hypothetical protein